MELRSSYQFGRRGEETPENRDIECKRKGGRLNKEDMKGEDRANSYMRKSDPTPYVAKRRENCERPTGRHFVSSGERRDEGKQ